MSGIYALYRNARPLRHSGRASFTLVELLIVIAIVAILAVAVILVLNPAELLKESRDATRLSDMDALNHGILLYEEDVGGSLGTASTTYVSIPDPAATSTAGDQCQGLGLPTSTAFTWHCAASSTYENVDGTGWIPIDFTKISFKQPFGALPKDPTNTTSSGLYYTYTPGGSYELTALLESNKYELGGSEDKESTDGGDDPALYETGSDLALTAAIPEGRGSVQYDELNQDAHLKGRWTFDEGGGSTAADASGNGNDGGLGGATDPPSWTTSGCVSGDCLSFDGTDDYVQVSNASRQFIMGDATVMLWINPSAYASCSAGYCEPLRLDGGDGITFSFYGGSLEADFKNDSGQWRSLSIPDTLIPLGTWTHITIVYDSAQSTQAEYVNGEFYHSNTLSNRTGLANNTNSLFFGAYSSGGRFYDGLLDSIRIYNRALSAAEISAIYNAEKP